MFEFITENIATVLLGLAILVAVVLVVFKMIKDKKNGRSSCGCGCESCGMKGSCHKTKKRK